jgi:hypothetical protein
MPQSEQIGNDFRRGAALRASRGIVAPSAYLASRGPFRKPLSKSCAFAAAPPEDRGVSSGNATHATYGLD